MTRFLVRVEPERMEEVQSSLRAMGVRPITKAFDYIVVDIPPALKPRIEAIPGVVEVVEEKPVRIALPVELKLSKFLEMGGPLNPTALLWSLSVKPRERWTTAEARKAVGADVAEKEGITGKGVKVAVCDTGIDAWGCPQLPSILPLSGTSTVEGQPWWQDENGHGTHVATTIGGKGFSTFWGLVEGVAPNVTLGFFKCLGYGVGSGTNTSVLKSMEAAAKWGADLINMSLGGDIKPEERHEIDRCPLCRAVKALSEAGTIFAIAAGNSGVGYASCPGIAPEAITVAAVDSAGKIADFVSRRHPQYVELEKPLVSAPGVNLLSSTVGLIDVMEWMDGFKLAAISGTSMATPMACGVLALWLEYARKKGYKLTYKEVQECIRTGRSWDPDYGYGLIRYEWVKEYLR
jgi:hypothetical protein